MKKGPGWGPFNLMGYIDLQQMHPSPQPHRPTTGRTECTTLCTTHTAAATSQGSVLVKALGIGCFVGCQFRRQFDIRNCRCKSRQTGGSLDAIQYRFS
jgi:hypothetical protein